MNYKLLGRYSRSYSFTCDENCPQIASWLPETSKTAHWQHWPLHHGRQLNGKCSKQDIFFTTLSFFIFWFPSHCFQSISNTVFLIPVFFYLFLGRFLKSWGFPPGNPRGIPRILEFGCQSHDWTALVATGPGAVIKFMYFSSHRGIGVL